MTLRFLDAQVLLAHCKADGDAREVEQYGESAEWAAESILNRLVVGAEIITLEGPNMRLEANTQ